jgi:hypothetical protein
MIPLRTRFLATLLATTAPFATAGVNIPTSALVHVDQVMVIGPSGGHFTAPAFELSPSGWQALAATRPGTTTSWLGFPLPDGGTVDLELERLAIASSQGGELWVDGRPSGKLITDGIALFTGHVLGEAGSDVYLAISPVGSRGWIRFGAKPDGSSRLVHILAEPGPANDWTHARLRLVDDAAVGLPPSTACRVDELTNSGITPASPQLQQTRTTPTLQKALATTPVLYELPIALETDYDFFTLFGNAGAAQSYAVALFGAISARYREQLDVIITLPYLGLYTTPADPWTSQDFGGTSIDLLFEFEAAWFPNMPVDAALGHFLSGADLGGGVAWVDALCVPEFRYGVTGNIGGNTPLPVAQGPLNWDFVAAAHEIGHNLSTLHTHDYCPPLDECAPSGYFGVCQTQQTCITDGTIMSYCHLCTGGMSNVTTYFHPTVVQTMRTRVEDSCLAPYEGLFVTDLGGGLSGSSGLPGIEATFDPATDELGVDYSHAPNPTAGALIVGGIQIDLPIYGGLLVPAPDVAFGITTSSPTGSLPKTSFAGTTYPTGAKLYMQAWYVDLAAPGGFAASPGLEVELVIPDAPTALTWFTNAGDGKEYAAIPAATWFKDNELAGEHDAHLVSIENPTVEAWLKATFFDSGLVSGPVYIGLTDENVEGQFGWTDGAPFAYTDWAAGEPNNWNGFEDYATFDGTAWNDYDGFSPLQALIER